MSLLLWRSRMALPYSRVLCSICVLFVFYLSSICPIIVVYCVIYILTCHCCCGVEGWHCRTAESYAQNPGPCPEKSLLLHRVVNYLCCYHYYDCNIYLKFLLRIMNSPLRHHLSWWSLGELELRAPGFDDYLTFQRFHDYLAFQRFHDYLAFQRFHDYLAFQRFDDYLAFQHRSEFYPEIRLFSY